MKNIFHIFFLPLYFFCVFAQVPSAIKILDVEVEGNVVTTDRMIRYTASLKVGDEVSPGDFAKAVKRMWRLGMFSDIQIRLDEETEEGIKITIVVEETPILGKISFNGNKKVKDSQLEEKLMLVSGQRLKLNMVHEKIQELKTLYTEEGFLLAEIESELSHAKTVRSNDPKILEITKDLIFHIKENRKVKIGTIKFDGNKSFSDWRLRRVIKNTKQQRWYLFWRSYFDTEKFEEDIESLSAFYKNKGYRDFMVLSDSIGYNSNKKKMTVYIKISEGGKYKFRNFTWEGNTLYDESILSRALGLKSGDTYNEENFNQAVYERMQSLYMDRGYIYSRIEPLVTPVGVDSLDIHFRILENHKVFVRNIMIGGNTKTRENVIRRELRIFPGDVFSREKLIRSQQAVWMLNYFSNVVPDVVRVDEDQVDLDLVVEEKSSDRANANIGFTGEYGMTGGGGLEFNNFRGLGQRLMFSFNTGTNYSIYTTSTPSKYQSVSLSFTDPMLYDTPNLIGFSIYYSFRGASTNYYFPLDFTAKGGSITWGRRFRWPDDYFRGNWALRGVEKEYSGDQEELDRYVKGLSVSRGINLTQIISRDSRNRPEFPTLGSMFTLKTTLSGGLLGGNEDFHKHVLKLEWYTPTFWKFVLKSSFHLGIIESLPSQKDELSIIPFDERFIMGGNGIPYGNMLRGYPDNSIGPVTPGGSPIGGNAMMKFNTEFRFPFSENPVVYGLIFGEMGNVWNSHHMMEPFNIPRGGALTLRKSVGVGIRFFMPMIGMLGFDLGYGFDDITGSGRPQGWTTTIIFGQPF